MEYMINIWLSYSTLHPNHAKHLETRDSQGQDIRNHERNPSLEGKTVDLEETRTVDGLCFFSPNQEYLPCRNCAFNIQLDFLLALLLCISTIASPRLLDVTQDLLTQAQSLAVGAFIPSNIKSVGICCFNNFNLSIVLTSQTCASAHPAGTVKEANVNFADEL